MGLQAEKSQPGSTASPRIFYAGIDEAGYGPRLGPLCIGLTMFETPSGDTDEPHGAPDLWKLLRGAVGRNHAAGKRGRLAVADSKMLKGVGGAGVDPLCHLERGVLAFDAVAQAQPAVSCENELLARLGVRIPASMEWYAGDRPLPRGSTADQMRILIAQLVGAAEAAHVRPLLVRAVAMDESTFNERYHHLQNKASVSFGVVGGMLRRLWESAAPESVLNVAVDRQGGRAFYARLLSQAVGVEFEVIEESDHVSRYEARAGKIMRVEFRVESESRHLPVALASMTAKLVREMLMRRFNEYWSRRIAGLRPTAGYGTDAGRWLRDVRPHAPREELEVLVRKA